MARQAASMVTLADTLPLAAVCTLHEWTSMMFPVAARDRRCTNSVRPSIVQVLLRLPTNTTALRRLGGAAATSCQLSSFGSTPFCCQTVPVEPSPLHCVEGEKWRDYTRNRVKRESQARVQAERVFREGSEGILGRRNRRRSS